MFDHIIGNAPIKAYLKEAIYNNRLANTLLFVGENGIGKSLFALAIAKKLMYPKDENLAAMHKVKTNNHPDLHQFFPEGKISMHSIASIRDLIDQVFMVPFEAKSKVFIIHDAERMLPSSANALLKTLEEPTLDSYIILISNKQEEVLPTITSRCLKLTFSLIAEEDITSFVQDRCHKNEKEASAIAKLAHGSIGKAYALAMYPAYDKKKMHLLEILAGNKRGSYFQFSEAISKLEDLYNKESYLEDAPQESFLKWHKEVDLLFSQILMWYRDLHIIKLKIDQTHLFFSDHLDLLKEQDLANLPSLERLHQLIEEAKLGVERNIRLKICLEHLFFQIGI